MVVEEKRFILDDFNLTEMGKYCGDLYIKLIPKKRQYKSTKIRLEVEEILKQMQIAYGESTECVMVCIKRRGGCKFEFRVKGESINPIYFSTENELLVYSRQLLDIYGVAPVYSYSKKMNTNIVSVDMIVKPVKNKMMISIFIALALAILTQFIITTFFGDYSDFLKDSIVSVIFTKMTTIITEVATFLVFFSVITGITGVGSSAVIGNMGKKLVSNAGFTYLVAAFVSSIIACLLYPLASMGGSGENVIKQLLQLVLDMIPNNLIDCFLKDNDLQVIVLAIFIGFVLLMMGKKVEPVNEALSTISDIVNKMMMIICKMLPIVVYFGILNLLLGDLSEIIKVYKVAIIFFGTSAVIIATLYIRVKRTTGISAFSLFKLQWPTTLINLSTSSQVAALTENVKCCKEKFGIKSNFVDFALPLCIVAYMPCGTGFLSGTIFGLADLSGISIDLTFVIKLAVMGVIVAIAAPPIPGSAFAVLPIMMAGAGVPDTFYSLAIVIGTVLGYFAPTLNGYCMQLEMLIVASKLDMIDKSKLGKKNVG